MLHSSEGVVKVPQWLPSALSLVALPDLASGGDSARVGMSVYRYVRVDQAQGRVVRDGVAELQEGVSHSRRQTACRSRASGDELVHNEQLRAHDRRKARVGVDEAEQPSRGLKVGRRPNGAHVGDAGDLIADSLAVREEARELADARGRSSTC